MSYIALYREWRPKTFHEIIGQEHITRTLQNQIIQGRIAHAYLLCGTRGTGKTTTAKVFAKAVNCVDPKDNEPCGKCEICLGIDNGSIMDVIEIDAASNNGVDNIRELRDDVKYLPSKCKYKVYIVDEVHMLSNAAFNALLKTLEEPPAHVMFILATTEFQKVPATIVSRCQRFDFKRIKMDDMIKRLQEIAEEGSVNVDDKTLRLIAKTSDGAMRDALSIFDQCISMSGKDVLYQDVVAILGISTDEYLIKIADEIAEGNVVECMSLIDGLAVNGKDIYQFIKDLTFHFRNLLITNTTGSASEILNVSDEIFEGFKRQSKKFSTESMLKNINILSAAESDAKWASQPRIILEMAVIRMCRKELSPDFDSIMERIARLEKILSGMPSQAVVRETAGKLQGVPDKQKEVEKKELERAARQEVKKYEGAVQEYNIELKDIKAKWEDVLKAISSKGHKSLYAFMIEGKPISISKNILTIGFEKNYGFHKTKMEDAENRKIAEEYISQISGSRISIKCVLVDEVAADKQEDDFIKISKSIFGEDLVQVEE